MHLLQLLSIRLDG